MAKTKMVDATIDLTAQDKAKTKMVDAKITAAEQRKPGKARKSKKEGKVELKGGGLASIHDLTVEFLLKSGFRQEQSDHCDVFLPTVKTLKFIGNQKRFISELTKYTKTKWTYRTWPNDLMDKAAIELEGTREGTSYEKDTDDVDELATMVVTLFGVLVDIE